MMLDVVCFVEKSEVNGSHVQNKEKEEKNEKPVSSVLYIVHTCSVCTVLYMWVCACRYIQIDVLFMFSLHCACRYVHIKQMSCMYYMMSVCVHIFCTVHV